MHSWKCVTLVDDENNVSPHSWFYTEFKQNRFLSPGNVLDYEIHTTLLHSSHCFYSLAMEQGTQPQLLQRSCSVANRSDTGRTGQLPGVRVEHSVS